MKALLDTHTFIWWFDAPEKLSAESLTVLQAPGNELLLSVASVWEMQIKMQLDKLRLSLPLRELVEQQQQENGLIVLPVRITDVFLLGDLPLHHKDPFDRLIIAQAIAENASVVTQDRSFQQYPVSLID